MEAAPVGIALELTETRTAIPLASGGIAVQLAEKLTAPPPAAKGLRVELVETKPSGALLTGDEALKVLLDGPNRDAVKRAIDVLEKAVKELREQEKNQKK